MTTRKLWAPQWNSRNHLDGVSRFLMFDDGLPKLFRTRRECREWIEWKFGYIRERDDLKREPHGWRVPRAVRVRVVLS